MNIKKISERDGESEKGRSLKQGCQNRGEGRVFNEDEVCGRWDLYSWKVAVWTVWYRAKISTMMMWKRSKLDFVELEHLLSMCGVTELDSIRNDLRSNFWCNSKSMGEHCIDGKSASKRKWNSLEISVSVKENTNWKWRVWRGKADFH